MLGGRRSVAVALWGLPRLGARAGEEVGSGPPRSESGRGITWPPLRGMADRKS